MNSTHEMEKQAFQIKRSEQHERLYQIDITEEGLNEFILRTADVGVENLEYVPYLRFNMAEELKSVFGEDFTITIRSILNDRKSGGFILSLPEHMLKKDEYVKFATAVVHNIGIPNFDSMSKKYYARFVVQHTDESDSYLRQAYRLFTLHTDGTYVDETTDWLLMMKMEERNAVGGESRLLHLDDWGQLSRYADYPLATYRFVYRAPASKNEDKQILNPTFYEMEGRPCICFIDQFVYPDTLEQARYLKEMSESLESSQGTANVKLPVGSLIMCNNHFWMHGRAPFEKNEKLFRELMRLRGYFSKV